MRLERILSVALVGGLSVLVAACPPSYAAVIRTGIGPVMLTVAYKDGSTEVTPLPTALLISGPLETIQSIEYRYGGRTCRLHADEIGWADDPQSGKPLLVLDGCSEASHD